LLHFNKKKGQNWIKITNKGTKFKTNTIRWQ